MSGEMKCRCCGHRTKPGFCILMRDGSYLCVDCTEDLQGSSVYCGACRDLTLNKRNSCTSCDGRGWLSVPPYKRVEGAASFGNLIRRRREW
jgi:hypothetical protein